jgi:hypothetical protein
MKIFGPATALPLVINILAGITLIVVVRKWLAGQGITSLAQLLILIALILLVPLPALVIFGMEHTLQVLFDFLFIYSFAAALGDRRPLSRNAYLYGLLVIAIRYEGIFIIAIACLLLLLQHNRPLISRFLAAIKLGLISCLPILVFGLYAMSKGSYFIPNSILVKSPASSLNGEELSQLFSLSELKNHLYSNLLPGDAAIRCLLLILLITFFTLRRTIKDYPVIRYIFLILTGATLLHLLLARIGNNIRYEAYLLGCITPIFGLLVDRYTLPLLLGKRALLNGCILLVLLLLATSLATRSYIGFNAMEQGSINIYEQQYQMGQFVKRYYPNTPVAMGDIGAISFYSTGRNLDLEGLGNLEVARSRKNHYWTPDFLYALSRQDSVHIAIVFDRSYSPQLLKRWNKIATWQIPNNVACFSDIVSFYAVDSMERPLLEKNLRAFQSSLPQEVTVRYP